LTASLTWRRDTASRAKVEQESTGVEFTIGS
jgi:hypothetical protein